MIMDRLDSWHATMWRVYSRHCCTPFLSLSRRGGVNWWLNQCRKTLDDGLFVFIILCEPCSDYSLLLRLGEGKLGVSRGWALLVLVSQNIKSTKNGSGTLPDLKYRST